jgi:hypothetical protein
MNMKSIGLMAFVLAVGLAGLTAQAVAEPDVSYNGHEITLLNVTQDNGKCTWTYEVCSGESPALSHWIIESCVGTTNEFIAWGTDPELNGTIEYGEDPSTGITGLKFDVNMDDGQCAEFWFTVNECSVTDQEVGVKAGGDVYTGSYIEGPAHEPSAAEFPLLATPVAILSAVMIFAYRTARKN